MMSAYNMLKENLGVAQMLIYVHTFNLSNCDLEIEFVLGTKDMEQWQVRTKDKSLKCNNRNSLKNQFGRKIDGQK